MPEPVEPNVTVIRAVIAEQPEVPNARGSLAMVRVDYLGSDGRWSCDAHPRARTCEHLRALAEFVAVQLGGDR